jgi:hypothetical protein
MYIYIYIYTYTHILNLLSFKYMLMLEFLSDVLREFRESSNLTHILNIHYLKLKTHTLTHYVWKI